MPQCCKPCVVGLLNCVGQQRAGAITRAAGHKDAYGLFRDVTMMKAWIAEYLAAWTALGLDAVVCPVNALPAFTHGAAYVRLGMQSESCLRAVVDCSRPV